MKLKNYTPRVMLPQYSTLYTAVQKHYTQTAAVYEWSTKKVITLRAYVFNFIQMSAFCIKSFCVHKWNVIPGGHNEDALNWICPVLIPSRVTLYPVQMGQKYLPR